VVVAAAALPTRIVSMRFFIEGKESADPDASPNIRSRTMQGYVHEDHEMEERLLILFMLNQNKQEIIKNQNSQEPDRVSYMNGGFARPGRDGSAILLATSNAFGSSDNNGNSNGQTVTDDIDEVDVDEEARSGGTDVNWEKKAIFDYDDDELALLAEELQDDEDLFNTMMAEIDGSIIVKERV
jgi:hypothetical protein